MNRKKLWLPALLAVVLIGLLVSCDDDTPAETAPQGSTEATETVTDRPSEEPDTLDTTETDNGDATDKTTDGEENVDGDVTDTEDSEDSEDDTEQDSDVQPGKLIHVSNDELRYLDNMGEMVGYAYEPGQYEGWTKRSLTIGMTQVNSLVDWGWAAFDSTAYTFGYIINGEQFFSEVYAAEAEAEVGELAAQKGASNYSRYYGVLTTNVLRVGDNQVQFCVRLDGGVLCVLREYTVTLSANPVKLDGNSWLVDMNSWEVSGHKPGITPATDPGCGGMVSAGGVEQGALLHQGSIGIGKVDLSKYKKVIVYFGCDSSQITQDHYNNNAQNRVILSRVDTNGKMSPDQKDIIASVPYTLSGWAPVGVEIDLTGINYNGPVYVTIDMLPGTFMLVTAIEFIGGGKPENSEPQTPPAGVNYAPALSDWTVSGHKSGVTSASDASHGAMVRAGGVTEAALLHMGAVGVGTVDLSQYKKVIVYYGCDNSGTTQNYYNNNAYNRIMLSTTDTDGKAAPEASDILAAATYTLNGWAPHALEIDLTGVNYNGPVYVSVDTLPGTFMLIAAIEFVV